MRISAALEAPKFIHYPAAALRAVLQHVEDKGAVATFMAITGYLWGGKSLEGSKAEWLDKLAIQERSFERHVASIGHSGGLCYHQPQRGYYVITGYPETDEEAELLRACWIQAEAGPRVQPWEIAATVDALFRANKASKLTGAIILSSLSDSDVNLKQRAPEEENNKKNEASNLTLREALAKPTRAEGVVLPESFVADVLELGWQGSFARLEALWRAGEAAQTRLLDLAAYHKQHRTAYSAAHFWEEARDGVARTPRVTESPVYDPVLPGAARPAAAPVDPVWERLAETISWTMPRHIVEACRGMTFVSRDEQTLVLAARSEFEASKMTHPRVLPRMNQLLHEITGNGTLLEVVVLNH